MTLRIALALVGIAALIVVGVLLASSPEVTDPPTTTELRYMHLGGVSNATGLALVTRKGRRTVATSTGLSEWSSHDAPPPLITFSDAVSGARIAGRARVGDYAGVRALTHHGGHVALAYGAPTDSSTIHSDGSELRLIDLAVLVRLKNEARTAGVTGLLSFAFEGMENTTGGWELVATATPRGTDPAAKAALAVFRLAFDRTGALTRTSHALKTPSGELHTDYAASLAVADGGVAIIGGYHTQGVYLAGWDGRTRKLELAVRRIGGVAWDAARNELWLVRECPGDDRAGCADDPRGVPLWVAQLPKGLPLI